MSEPYPEALYIGGGLMSIRKVIYFAGVLASVNAGLVLQYRETTDSRSFEILQKDQLAQVRGGACWSYSYYPCDGVSETCDGGTDLNPYPAGNCDMTFNPPRCKHRGKERYILKTNEEDYFNCDTQTQQYINRNTLFDFVCHKLQTCPTNCMWNENWERWQCADGTGVTNNGIHQIRTCLELQCPSES